VAPEFSPALQSILVMQGISEGEENAFQKMEKVFCHREFAPDSIDDWRLPNG
jgi:hypothetical protein